MKKVSSILIMLLVIITCQAQDFPTTWKAKFAVDADKWTYDDNAKYILGRSSSEAEVLDGATGKSIWKLNFKSDLKVKELNRGSYNYNAGVICFFNNDEKKAGGDKVMVDFATGKELWRTTGYTGIDNDDQWHFATMIATVSSGSNFLVFDSESKRFMGLDVRTGAKKWESKPYETDIKKVSVNAIDGSEFAQIFIFEGEEETTYQTTYMSITTGEILKDDSRFSDANANSTRMFYNNVKIKRTLGNTSVKLSGKMRTISAEKIKFTLTVKGDATWTKEFDGKAVRQIFNDAPYVRMDVQGDKIFVMSKNITVFDLKTGTKLWEAPFDNCDASVGLKAKQEFGIAGWPLADANAVYYVDLKVDNSIKKVNAQTGKVVWQSEKFKSNDRVPNLILIDGVLIAQFGGMLNTQIYIPGQGGGYVKKSENRFDGNFEVRAYDQNTGALLWTTTKLGDKIGDKFKDRISTVYTLDNKLYVASDKNLFCFSPKDGSVLYKTSLADSKIGDLFELLLSEDSKKFYIFCDNGIAAADVATGKITYATKTPEIFWKVPGTSTYSFYQGANNFVWVGEKDFIGFDLSKGAIKGKMEDNDNPQLTADGNYIFVKDGEKLSKFTVNK